ncbi:hypothetical protein [Burkholderia thailandensis]|uniref:hypothetical protein n=1 Tax=Burkholderia thailandensis TaxID=57975 RepID=UPI0003ECA0DF|nr:hypothetical protein [Burkholderia thailandensis]AHI64344.1 hypothetical protein BTL_54 [Burkholderia thailandensis H0587]AJY27979.1 hypothetical protein BTM_2278 [Burkholderia thailandensis 34]AOJ52170.1 hypothetical protein AQ475_15975 [Burkholderia thailandensis]AOJ57968.1 hypothetical protein AQ477_16640 [Burkholderia thailandensis]AVR24527.1 hypothetical protein A8H32_04745 [Burkholderia thailandensis]
MRQPLAALAALAASGACVAALCVAPLVAACSDDASHARARANADASPAQGADANAFNGNATAAGDAGASAPLATPVIHYPPEDGADDAPGATAASAQPASNPG